MKAAFPVLNGYMAMMGLSKNELAAIIGCSKGTIVNKLNGITEFRLCEAEIIWRFVNRWLTSHDKEKITFEELFFV